MDPKAVVVESITRAQAELDEALAQIDAVTAADPALIGRVAHSLANYMSVTVAAVELLHGRLAGHEDPDIPIWLEGISHAADLMQHSVGLLVSNSVPKTVPLKTDQINLHVFMERACQYYRRRVANKDIRITCMAVGHLPLVVADRVAVAIIADNLLSNAVRHTQPRETVRVQLTSGNGTVVCRVQRGSASLTAQEEQLLGEAVAAIAATAPKEEEDIGIQIAEEFVTRLGGELWHEGAPGRGSYAFSLPVFRQAGL